MDYSFPVCYFRYSRYMFYTTSGLYRQNLNARTRQAGLRVPRIRFGSYAYRFGLDLNRIFWYRPIVVYTVRPL
jgi:hypothetical protein